MFFLSASLVSFHLICHWDIGLLSWAPNMTAVLSITCLVEAHLLHLVILHTLTLTYRNSLIEPLTLRRQAFGIDRDGIF